MVKKNQTEYRSEFPFIAKTLATLAVLHLVVVILLDKVMAFAPDENAYLAVFEKLYVSDFSLDGYLGWNEGSINFLRFFYAPAKLISLLGATDLVSIRLLAIGYFLLSAYMLLRMSSDFQILQLPTRKWIAIFCFTPSLLFWTSLGLRESFIFCSLVAVLYLINKYMPSGNTKYLLFLLIAASGLMISKLYLYVILFFSLILGSLILIIKARKFDTRLVLILFFYLVPLFLIPSKTSIVFSGIETFVTSTISSNSEQSVSSVESDLPGTSSSVESDLPGTSSPILDVKSRGGTLHALTNQLKNNSTLEFLTNQFGIAQFLKDKSMAAVQPQNDAKVVSSEERLSAQPASLRNPMSIFRGVFSFLFVPIPFFDNGSLFLNIQAYESFVWMLIYLLYLNVLWRLIKGRYELTLVPLSAVLFVMGFVLQSSLIEINVGTAVRHRSVLLVATLIAVAAARKSDNSRAHE